MSWKLVAHAPKHVVQRALAAHEALDEWPADVVLTGAELAEDRPDDWVLEAYLPRRPGKGDRSAIVALFPSPAPDLATEKLPETDWVAESQKRVAPIRAGRFHVHTPDHPADDTPGTVDFTIPAAQAFGTGQHATTAGCLAMLDTMRRSGTVVRSAVDIGTGTGLLAFAARALWPGARFMASDIDPVCEAVVAENARLNRVPLEVEGAARRGSVAMVTAPGTEHPLIQSGGPYDLVIANILAGPLIELAGDLAALASPRASLLLAGLLTTQENAVRAAYRTAGFRLAARLHHGDWSILWLRARRS